MKIRPTGQKRPTSVMTANDISQDEGGLNLLILKQLQRNVMPFFQLSEDEVNFPPAHFADPEGLIAVGGNLEPRRVIEAYRNGIYFWFGPMDPLKWWSPDPRVILRPEEVQLDPAEMALSDVQLTRISDIGPLLRKIQEKENQGELGPQWLTEEMYTLYTLLHESGHCQAFDVLCKGQYVGSLFGIVIGKVFFLEYVYTPGKKVNRDDNNICVYAMAQRLHDLGYNFIDIQKENVEISDFGIMEVSRLEYLDLLKKSIDLDPPFVNQSGKP